MATAYKSPKRQNPQPQPKKKKLSSEAQFIINTYLKPAQEKRLKKAEVGATKARDTRDKNIARTRKLDANAFANARKAALRRDQGIAKMKSKLDYKGVPHTEVDRSVNFTDSTIPGMPMTANVTEAVTAKGPKKPTRDENITRIAALNKEIAKLASLKTASADDAASMSDKDKEYYANINAAKRAHIANLVAEKNRLEGAVSPQVVNKPTTTPPPGNTEKNDLEKLTDFSIANPESLDVNLQKAGINPASLDSIAAEAKKLAEKKAAKKNPENWSLNKKTRFRRAWRAKHAKDLNSRDPKVSTPIRLTLQQLQNWEKGNGPFPESLKSELK